SGGWVQRVAARDVALLRHAPDVSDHEQRLTRPSCVGSPFPFYRVESLQMKVLIARMNHETNTFSPVPTPLSSFGNDGPTYDAAAYAENKGKRTAMSAFIDLAEAHGA